MPENQTNAEPSSRPHSLPSGSEPFDLITFWETHRPKILGAAVALAVIVVAITIWQMKKHSTLQNAEEEFAAAKDDNYRAVIAAFPDTPTAARAIIITAHQEFNAGRYDEAISLYDEFQRRFPKHPYIETVPYNFAACFEAKGQYKEAADGYDKFIKGHPRSYLTPHARLALGRCHEALGEWQKAKEAYEKMIVLSQQSPFAADAQERYAFVLRKLPRETPKPDAGTLTPPAESSTLTPIPAEGTLQSPKR